MTELDPLSRFGQFLMKKLRDRAIWDYDMLAAGRWKAPILKQLQADLEQLSEPQRSVVRRCVVASVDHAIHDFLFALQELAAFDNDIQVLVRGQNVAQMSDGLQGELFGEEGWEAKYSVYGPQPELA